MNFLFSWVFLKTIEGKRKEIKFKLEKNYTHFFTLTIVNL